MGLFKETLDDMQRRIKETDNETYMGVLRAVESELTARHEAQSLHAIHEELDEAQESFRAFSSSFASALSGIEKAIRDGRGLINKEHIVAELGKAAKSVKQFEVFLEKALKEGKRQE
jgi:hypothetical protein